MPSDGFVNRIRGFYEKVTAFPSGYSNDGVYGITVASGSYAGNYIRIRKGTPNTMEAGVLTDGTDQTARLNAIMALSKLKTLILDYESGGTITINGTVDCQGKELIWREGTYFTGTGTLTNLKISAGEIQKLFDTSVSVTDFRTQTDCFSVRWYGAKGDDSQDDQPACQKSIDTVVANQSKVKDVFFPAGSYLLGAPLIIYKWNGTAYQQVTINLIGEFDYCGTEPNGTRLYLNFRNTFAIGVQLGKSCRIEGFIILGQFTPPPVDSAGEWFRLTLEEFTDGLSRDARYSPYSGIVIDPFRNSNDIPSDGGYPGLTSFYRGPGGTNGSTGTYIRDCYILNVVIGVMNSPNGVTLNGELTFVERCQFSNVKICVTGTQDQEKANKIYDLMCWQNTHTIFATGIYGIAVPGNWYVEIVNLAGAINQIVYNNGLGFYPSHFEKIFAESVGKIGFLGGDGQSSFKHSVIDLQRIDPGGGYTNGSYDWSIVGFNCLFESCVIRYYGTAMPVSVLGKMYFRNCSFEIEPYCPTGVLIDSIPYNVEALGPSLFEDCSVNNNPFTNSQERIVQPSAPKGDVIMGLKRYIDKNTYRQGAWTEVEINGGESCTIEYWGATFNLAPFSIVVTAGHQIIVNVTAAHINKFEVGRIAICDSHNYLMGIVTNVNTGTNVVTISYVPPAIEDGDYYIGCVYPKKFYGSFIGDFTAASVTVNNVVFDNWGTDTSLVVGTVVEVPQITNFAFVGKYQNVVRILAYNAGLKTITLDSPANITQEGAYCGYGTTKKILRSLSGGITPSSFPASTILPAGSEGIFYDQRYLVTKTGFVDAVAVGGGETRQAQWYLTSGQQNIRTATTNTTLTFEDKTVLVDTTSGNITVTINPTIGTFNYTIKRITAGANTLTISPSSGTIDGGGSYSLADQYDTVVIQSNGTNLFVVSSIIASP